MSTMLFALIFSRARRACTFGISAERNVWLCDCGLTAEYPATPKHIWNLWLRGYGATRLEAKLGAR